MRSNDGFAPSGSELSRHSRVWLDRSGWRSQLLVPLDAATLTALDDWIDGGRALVARRRDSEHADACHLGVVLPPAAGKRRVPLVVDRDAVVKVAPPMSLAEAIVAAPSEWRVALGDLVDRGAASGTTFRVYGSLAWQAMSGEPYVGPTSDVDLLWNADGDAAIRRVLDLLVDWVARHGLRADGELVLADGGGVAWRELLGSARHVLVKHQHGVSLQASPLMS